MIREHITERAHGLDCSHYQEEFILDNTWGQLDFAIAKIGEGYNTPYHNPVTVDMNFEQFLPLWDEGVARLDIRGVYFYQRSGYSWEFQASQVLEALGKLAVKPQFIACDVEKINNSVDKSFLADALRIMDYWKVNSPYTVMLYTNKDVLQNYIQPIGLRYYGQEWLNRLYAYPLWYAQYWILYSPDKQPGLPTFKPDWKLWQYTDKGDSYQVIDGVRYRHYGSPDLNVFNGTPADMRAWLEIGATPPEPPAPPSNKTITGVRVSYSDGTEINVT